MAPYTRRRERREAELAAQKAAEDGQPNGSAQTPDGALSDPLELLKLSVAKLRPELAKIEDVTVLAALLAGEEAGQKRGTIIADLTHRIAAHSQSAE